jgi:hypothetical protein
MYIAGRPDSIMACDALTCVTSPFIMRSCTPLVYPFGRNAHGSPTQAPQEQRLLDDKGRRRRNLLRQDRPPFLRRRPPPLSRPPQGRRRTEAPTPGGRHGQNSLAAVKSCWYWGVRHKHLPTDCQPFTTVEKIKTPPKAVNEEDLMTPQERDALFRWAVHWSASSPLK